MPSRVVGQTPSGRHQQTATQTQVAPQQEASCQGCLEQESLSHIAHILACRGLFAPIGSIGASNGSWQPGLVQGGEKARYRCVAGNLKCFLCHARCQGLVVRAATAVAEQKIQIKLKAYEADLLQQSVALISEAASSTGAKCSGPVYLPTR